MLGDLAAVSSQRQDRRSTIYHHAVWDDQALSAPSVWEVSPVQSWHCWLISLVWISSYAWLPGT